MKGSKKVTDGTTGKIIKVVANQESSYYLYENGEARACGRNDEGQLGDGTFINTSTKNTVVAVKLSVEILDLAAGPSSQSVFFMTDGDVYASGLNDRYQLGIGEIGSQELPKRVLFDGTVDLAYISSSGTHTVAMGKTILDTEFPTWVSARRLLFPSACRRRERRRIGALTDAHVLCPLHRSVADLRHGRTNAVSHGHADTGECGIS